MSSRAPSLVAMFMSDLRMPIVALDCNPRKPYRHIMSTESELRAELSAITEKLRKPMAWEACLPLLSEAQRLAEEIHAARLEARFVAAVDRVF